MSSLKRGIFGRYADPRRKTARRTSEVRTALRRSRNGRPRRGENISSTMGAKKQSAWLENDASAPSSAQNDERPGPEGEGPGPF
jgi:hypothetical protein